MRISKKSSEIKTQKVDASKDLSKRYEDSMNHIKSAIDCLADCINDSESGIVARDSIANLSVIYLDLQSR